MFPNTQKTPHAGTLTTPHPISKRPNHLGGGPVVRVWD